MHHVALIGFGRMGQMHYEILKKLTNFNVKYIIDHNAGKNITPVSELENILQDPELSGVIIVTSSDAHLEMIELSSQYQSKIFCEKPISFQVGSLVTLQKKLNARGVDLQVGLNRRFDPHYQALQNQLKAGTIGQPQVIKITNRDPKRPDLAFAKRSGGLIYDFVIHDFDMLNFLTDAKVIQRGMISDAIIEPQLKAFNDIDTALISMKLNDGCLVTIDVSRESGIGYDQRIEVLGKSGMLKVDNLSPTTLNHIHQDGHYRDLPHYSFVERYHQAYQNQFKSYGQWLSGDLKSPAVGLNEMISAVKLANEFSK